jgi:uncharacterized membrane protein YcaP (DUF421 family)
MYTIIHAIIGYFFLLLTVRLLSRRPGAQMTPFEFVLIFLIGGIIILSTMGNDRSETGSVCTVITIGLIHGLVSYLKQRFPSFGVLVDGTPLVLLKDGEWQADVMRRMRVDKMDVMAAARAKGARTLDDIKYAVLERNGGISVIKRKQQ